MFPARRLARPKLLPAARPARFLASAALLACLAFAGRLAAEGPSAILDPGGIRFQVEDRQRWSLTVSGPGGFYLRGEFDDTAPALSLVAADGSLPADGAYVWELRRLDAPASGGRVAVHSGTFHVANGSTLVPAGAAAEEAAGGGAALPDPLPSAPTHAGDVSIKGQLCVGQDCDEFVPLPVEAIRMHQNNAWLRVSDTSDELAADPFPSNDWQIKFNDPTRLSQGGANYFGIEDRSDDGSSSTISFRVDAGAPADSVRVDQNGRVGLGTATPSATLQVAGDAVVDGNLTAGSSRELKQAFAPVDPRQILGRLVELPLSEWSYRGEPPTIRHLGPVAEEFRAAFALGRDGRHVSPLDLSGVAFAAIQGLHDVVRERQAEIAELRASRKEMAARLEALERRLAPAPLGTGSFPGPR